MRKKRNKTIQQPNEWRKEPGTEEPLRVGRGIRTRDEYFAGQNNNQVHTEIKKEELYRRGVVLDIDDDENLAVVKTHTTQNSKSIPIPDDEQKRRYQREILTQSGSNAHPKPIRLQKGKVELGTAKDNVTPSQAKKMLDSTKKSSKQNAKRLEEFRKNKKKS